MHERSVARDAVELPGILPPRNPYSRAIVHGGLAYVSGIVPVDLVTGALTGDEVATQTQSVLDTLNLVLAAAGSGLGSLLKVSVYLIDAGDFEAMNDVYRLVVPQPWPARTTVTVARLGRPEVRIELDAISAVDSPRPAPFTRPTTPPTLRPRS